MGKRSTRTSRRYGPNGIGIRRGAQYKVLRPIHNILGRVPLIQYTRVGHRFLGALSHTRGDRDRSRQRARLSGHTITATAHVRVKLTAYVRIKPPSVLNACGSRAHDPLHDTRITRCEHGCPRRPRSQSRRSASSMRSPASPTTTAATTQTIVSLPTS